MRLRSRSAGAGWAECWPNPSVGAVIASADGRIIGCGWTEPGGRPHAEAVALAEAGERGARRDRFTPRWSPARIGARRRPVPMPVIAAGITRVVYGVVDPDPRVAGRG